eukprot:CAMPEP_0198120942 /NCGR_PEP_ID=MMETSP1442-20131203/30739_1 /TAXON_ID= /ORGANISM="Craspedostauros australis, Strain CCMP3328" /LENGTH=271 /DNA_ID=CAMNT_0043779677 /DNA_START=51 /DNA_END=866 /DNA_ORIENTATION=-
MGNVDATANAPSTDRPTKRERGAASDENNDDQAKRQKSEPLTTVEAPASSMPQEVDPASATSQDMKAPAQLAEVVTAAAETHEGTACDATHEQLSSLTEVAQSDTAPAAAAAESDAKDGGDVAASQKDDTTTTEATTAGAPSTENQRWRVHQIAEDYVGMVGAMMYPSTKFKAYGYDPSRREYPTEGMSLLGFLQSPVRRPSVIEMWSPHEIALFEGCLFHYGKDFHEVSRVIKTKSTKEVIDFYYIWKKTEHYKKWKAAFVKDTELAEME